MFFFVESGLEVIYTLNRIPLTHPHKKEKENAENTITPHFPTNSYLHPIHRHVPPPFLMEIKIRLRLLGLGRFDALIGLLVS